MDKSSFLRDGQDGDGKPGARARLERRFEPSAAEILADGIERPQSNAHVTYWTVCPELMISRSRSLGETIWSLYALSSDLNMLAVTSWDEVRPADRDIEVYWRQPDADGVCK